LSKESKKTSADTEGVDDERTQGEALRRVTPLQLDLGRAISPVHQERCGFRLAGPFEPSGAILLKVRPVAADNENGEKTAWRWAASRFLAEPARS
jgi:hypothetical protein